MTRALEGDGRSVVSGGRSVSHEIGGTGGYVALDNFEGYSNSSEVNGAYDNATDELTLRTDGRLEGSNYLEETTGRWYGNSSFVSSDETEYNIVMEMTRDNGTAGLILHTQSLNSSQDIVNNCLRMVVRGEQNDLILAEYNQGYNRHWSVDVDIEANTPYIISGWTEDGGAVAELREYSQGINSEPIARVTTGSADVTWSEGFVAFEGDAQGEPVYFDLIRSGDESDTGQDDPISGVQVIDDFEDYSDNREFTSAWSGHTTLWYLTEQGAINGTYGASNQEPNALLAYDDFTTQEGKQYSALISADGSQAVSEFQVNKQSVSTTPSEIGATVNINDQQFRGYVAEDGEILDSSSQALDLSAQTTYKVEIDMYEGDVECRLVQDGTVLANVQMTNDTSFSTGMVAMYEKGSVATVFDDIREEGTEMTPGEGGGGGGGGGGEPVDTTIEDFEDNSLSEYTGGTQDPFAITTNQPHSGTYSLESQSDGSELRMFSPEGNGLNYYPQQGDKWEFYTRAGTVNSDFAVSSHMFAAKENGGRYRFRIRWHQNMIQLRGTDGNGETIGSTGQDLSFDLQADSWYRVVIEWDDGETFGRNPGEIQATIHDANSSDTTTIVWTDTTYTQGGIGWSVDKYGGQTIWFDDATWLNPPDDGTFPNEVIDSFEDSELNEYSGDTSEFSITSTETYIGDYALVDSGTVRHDIRSPFGNGLNYYPAEGDTFEFYAKADEFSSEMWCQSIFVFGFQGADRFYSVRLKWADDRIQIGKSTYDTVSEVATDTLPWSYQQDTWYRVEVFWSDGSGEGNTRGDINVTVEDVDGNNSFSLSGNDTDYTDGGIGFAADKYDNQNLYFDHSICTNPVNGGPGDGSGGSDPGGGGDPSTGAGTIHDFENQSLSAYTLVEGKWSHAQFTDSSESKIGGYQFYDGTVPQSEADYLASNEAELHDAMSRASADDLVYITDDIDMRDSDRRVRVPEGVDLAGDRGIDGSPGPEVICRETNEDQQTFYLGGNNHVSGFRVRGWSLDWSEHHVSYYRDNLGTRKLWDDHGLYVWGDGCEFENMEVYGFGGACINMGDYNGEVHHCHIHRARLDGVGYGIGGAASSGQGKESSYYHDNVFHYCRHAIADSGYGSYYVENNSFEGPLGGNVVDVHDEDGEWAGGGDKIEIYNNFFPISDGTESGPDATAHFSRSGWQVLYIQRGKPSTGGYYYRNWGYNPYPPPERGPYDHDDPGDYDYFTIDQASDHGKDYTEWDETLHWGNNQYGSDEPDNDDIGLLGDGRQLIEGSNHALRFATGRRWTQFQSTSGLENYPSAGDSFEFYFRAEHDTTFQSGFLFGVQDESTTTGHYEIDIRNDQIRFERDHHDTAAGEDELLGSMEWDFDVMQTYQFQVHWPSDPELEGVTIDVYNHTQGFHVGTIDAAADSTYTEGGIGFYDNSFPCVFFDRVQFIEN